MRNIGKVSDASKMWMALDKVRNRTSNLPAKAYAKKSYLDAMTRDIGMVVDEKVRPPEGAMGSFAGMPVYESNLLPQGVLCVFMDKDNKMVGRIVDETYVPNTTEATDQERK